MSRDRLKVVIVGAGIGGPLAHGDIGHRRAPEAIRLDESAGRPLRGQWR